MRYRPLGKSPLQVSALCLGTMMFADQTDLAEARRITAHAREHGVNFIDTADVYSLGKSESMVGELLNGQRDDWVLATKVGNKMSERPNESHYSRTWVQRECDASLRRLGVDHVDLYYLHRDYNGMDLEEPLRAIDALLAAGKIRYWGLSNFRGWRIAEAVHGARQLNMPGPVVCQPYYNLLNRQPEVEVLEACRHHGIGVVPYSPIARGPRRQAHAADRVPRGVARHRGNAQGTLPEEGRRALALCQRLGAGAPGRQRSDRRATHLRAVDRLLRRARGRDRRGR
jgi:aryl-alcohol dehydrogenase-like predicted oxidoreductase